ncbi:hypothetical protein [Metabacillus mangrovi]
MIRAADVDDLLLNTAGCVIGYFVYQAMVKLISSLLHLDVRPVNK